jgi:hypothetical protein
MNENNRPKPTESPIVKSTVVSKEGAAIRVERIEVTERMRQSLTTSVKDLGLFSSGGTE